MTCIDKIKYDMTHHLKKKLNIVIKGAFKSPGLCSQVYVSNSKTHKGNREQILLMFFLESDI